MKFRQLLLVALLSSYSLCNAAGFTYSNVHQNKRVAQIVSPDQNRPCSFFYLEGVQQADAISPNQIWFAVPKNHPGYKEILSILHMAKGLEKSITVYTTGKKITECSNLAEVKTVVLE